MIVHTKIYSEDNNLLLTLKRVTKTMIFTINMITLAPTLNVNFIQFYEV